MGLPVSGPLQVHAIPILLLLGKLFHSVLCHGETGTHVLYQVRGEVVFQGKGAVYVALVDKNSFFNPEKGIAHHVFPTISSSTDNESKRGAPTSLPFLFAGVPEGLYALVAFLDENGNGRLDRGVFGPTEPWGMSFRGPRPPFRSPRFEEAMFRIPEENRVFRIELKR